MKIIFKRKISASNLFIHYLLVGLIFLLIYYPPIFPINTLHILAIIAYLYFAVQKRINGIEIKILSSLALPMLLLMIIIFIFSFLFWDNIILDVNLFVIVFETIPIAIMITKIKNKKLPKSNFLDLVISAALIQSFIALLALVNPIFHNIIIDRYLVYGFDTVLQQMAEWRLFGYSYTLAYAMPVVQSCIASIAIYKGMTHSKKYIIYAFLIFISALINARLSIVLFSIGGFGALLFSNKFEIKHLYKILWVSIIAFLVLYSAFEFVYGIDSKTALWIQEGLGDIANFLYGNSLSEYSYMSYVTSEEQYQLPVDFLSMIVGTGNITMRGNITYNSDIGFINDIWYGGFVFCLWNVSFYAYKTKKMFKYLNKTYSTSMILYLVFIVILLLANLKGQAFSWNEITQLLLLCMVFYQYEQEKNYRILQKGVRITQ